MKFKIKKELKVGIFAIAVIALGYWGINFLKGIDVLSSNTNYYAYYDKSNDIQVSAPVLVRGIKIGTVTNVEIEDINSLVKVTLTVEKRFQIPTNSVATIASTSIIGGKAIDIEIGDSKETIPFNSEIKGQVDNSMSEQIDEAKTKMYELIAKLNTTLEGVSGVLNEKNTRELSETFENISALSGNLNSAVEIESKKIGEITKNLETVTAMLSESSPALQSSISNLDSITTAVNNANLGTILESASQTIESLNGTIAKINEGDGSVGKFFNDPSLYNSLNGASEQLNSLLLDLETNPKRYVHFSIFGRSGKKKDKEEK